MKLYGSPRSPFVRKVRVAAAELGLADRIELIDCEPSEMRPEFVAANPIAKIPALVAEDGTALPESNLIVAYLEEAAGRAVTPSAGAARWAALRQLAVADGLMEAGVARLSEKRRPDGERSPAEIDKLNKRMSRCLDALEAEVARFAGALTIGQIAAGCACGYTDFRSPDLNWREGRPNLAAWFARFDERPAMASTRPSM